VDDRPTPQIEAFAASLASLASLCDSALGAQSIDAILRASKLLEQLAADGDQLLEELAATLGGSAAVLNLDDQFRTLQDQLAALVQAARGQSPTSQPLATVHHGGLQWTRDLGAFTASLAEQKQRFEERVRLRQRLDAIAQALQRPCFRLGRAAWAPSCQAALERLGQSAELANVEPALQPLAVAWQDTEAARGLAAHYGAADTWQPAAPPPDQPASAWLAVTLTAIGKWMESEEDRLGRLELARLPDAPTGREPWFRAGIALLTMYLELRLAPNRTAKQQAIRTLARLADLAEASRTLQAWALEPGEALVPRVALELAVFQGQVLDGTESVARVLGQEQQAIDLVASLLVQASQRDPLWRMPPVGTDGAAAGRVLPLVRQAARQAARLPGPVLLNVLAAGLSRPEETARRLLEEPQAPPALLDLGPLGAWLLTSCLAAARQEVNSDRVKSLFLGHDRPADANLLMPLVLLPSLRRDEIGMMGLLAALELLSHRRHPDLVPLEAAWAFSARWSREYPTLCQRLERLCASPSTSTASSSSITQDENEVHLAEFAAQHAVRPRSYRGVRSVEHVSRLFVDEVASRLLESAREADSKGNLEKLLAEVRAEHGKMEDFVQRQTKSFRNPPEGRLLAALLHECGEMLVAIERYLDRRLQQIQSGSVQRSVNRANLQRELEQLSHQGWAGTVAAGLLTALMVEGRPPMVQLPADLETAPPARFWYLPRCLRAWQAVKTDLNDYLSCLHDDLTGKGPVDYALEVADREGQLDFAEELLRHVPVADPSSTQRLLAGHRTTWTELVTAELDELRRLAAPLGDLPELSDLEGNIEQGIREGGFDVALKNLGRLRELIQRQLDARKRPPGPRELLDIIERLMERIYHAGLAKETQRDLRIRLQKLERKLETDAGAEVRRQVDEELRAITATLPGEEPAVSVEEPKAVVQAPPAEPPPVVVPEPRPMVVVRPPVVEPPAVVVPAPPVVEPPKAAPRYGIIKRMVGRQFGFIAPLDESESDVFFHKNNLIGDLTPLGTDLERAPGQLMAYELKPGSGQDRPPVEWCRPCVGPEAAAILGHLAHRLGNCPQDVGALGETNGQRAILTDQRGFFAVAQGGMALPRGALVCFEVIDEHDRLAKVTDTPAANSVAPGRKKLLERLLGPAPTASSAAPIDGPINAALLLQARPGETQAITLVRALHERAHNGDRRDEVLAALRDLRDQQRPEATWWQAMFIYEELLASDDPDRRGGLLRDLVDRQFEWASRNFDVVVAWIYRALRELADDHPDLLTLEEVLTFLGELQKARGTSPHFRLEVLQARVREALYDERGDSDDLRRALAHANHALILNPRLDEGLLLRDSLKRKATQARVTEGPVPQPPPTSDQWLQDPIEGVAFIKNFYQREVIGPDGARKARDLFDKYHGVVTGVALNQLIQEHARHLQQVSKHLEAEQIVLGYLLAHKPDQGWQPLLRLLQDLWTGLRLPFDQTVAKIDQVKPCVPQEGQYYLSLILARLAYQGGKYDLARRYAEESDAASSTAEAQQIIRRVQAMLGQVPAAAMTREERREAALERIRRAADQDEGRGPIDLILDVMDDLEVGPWLVRRAIEGKCGFTLDEAESISLVRRAQGLAARPTPDLFYADVAVTWGKMSPFLQEGEVLQSLGPTRLEEILLHPDDPALLGPMMHAIGAHRPWSAFVFVDCLNRLHEDNVRLRWQRSVCARNIQRKEDYVESALSCVGMPLVPEASFVRVANDLISLKLHGLALGMAALAHEPNTLAAAEQDCRLEVWEWPSCLHEAKKRYADWEWAEAADRIIRVLVAAPEHWPACRVFSEIFTRGLEEDVRRRCRALELAEAVVLYLQQRLRRESPELMVLLAELRHQREGLRGADIQTGLVEELIRLCTRAQEVRSGFRPAADLKNHLTLRGEARYAEGEQVGNFRMGRELGEGSFGRVYEATVINPSQELPERVTLKFVRLDAATPEKFQERVRSLEREARIALRFDHPHIVKTYGFMDLKGHKCLVMEFIDGFTLAEKIEKHSLMPWPFVARVALQVAQGLEYARLEAQREPQSDTVHSREFAHCDIHPRNIMVRNTEDGPQAKLLDFALARLPGASSMTSVVFKGINKRLYYRDPDYPRGGSRGDMFSLGVILYELLVGKPPYPVDRYYDYQVQQALPADVEALRQPVSALATPGTEIPPRLEGVLLRMVAFKRNQRYENWDKLIDELTPLVGHESAVT
jgi:hypothetical protein